ncbi:hypothetical protein GEMRC1_011478 [Eukaryota sp. GEM-RC1]
MLLDFVLDIFITELQLINNLTVQDWKLSFLDYSILPLQLNSGLTCHFQSDLSSFSLVCSQHSIDLHSADHFCFTSLRLELPSSFQIFSSTSAVLSHSFKCKIRNCQDSTPIGSLLLVINLTCSLPATSVAATSPPATSPTPPSTKDINTSPAFRQSPPSKSVSVPAPSNSSSSPSVSVSPRVNKCESSTTTNDFVSVVRGSQTIQSRSKSRNNYFRTFEKFKIDDHPPPLFFKKSSTGLLLSNYWLFTTIYYFCFLNWP